MEGETQGEPAFREAENGTIEPVDDVEEGDEIAITFNNIYDKRYSDKKTVKGEVRLVQRDLEGSHVAVKVLSDGKQYAVKGNGDVLVGDIPDMRLNSVGRVKSSQYHG